MKWGDFQKNKKALKLWERIFRNLRPIFKIYGLLGVAKKYYNSKQGILDSLSNLTVPSLWEIRGPVHGPHCAKGKFVQMEVNHRIDQVKNNLFQSQNFSFAISSTTCDTNLPWRHEPIHFDKSNPMKGENLTSSCHKLTSQPDEHCVQNRDANGRNQNYVFPFET